MKRAFGYGKVHDEMSKVIKNLFLKYFKNFFMVQDFHQCLIDEFKEYYVITNNIFEGRPTFFLGGNVGKLSICNTINNLAVKGSKPIYIICTLVLNENISIGKLEEIIKSMGEVVIENNIKIILADVHILNKREEDTIFINTTGIGIIYNKFYCENKFNIKCGDKVILSGSIGEHEISILSNKEYLDEKKKIKSDCTSLYTLIRDIISLSDKVKIIENPTSGIVNSLKKICEIYNKSIIIREEQIPIKEGVKNICDILGIEVLNTSNEGKILLIVDNSHCNKILKKLKESQLGQEAKIIGEVVEDNRSNLYLGTILGGVKIYK
ncbi:hydrogenase expression/formation protein HypE [Clostridium tarantellae]|uniref:Hydrogenase expression/formation protein HypE n=1 Tax=Clostridium tarantellae TaxID=39493 RepID=A0A6I1ML87_9CLOT|nr:hydrogenase expression/formation protein HypE [Clostridium tarantellae]MPQ43744.1 hydrogenase expression/formation protein HypE [Clostridium tarantellae]